MSSGIHAPQQRCEPVTIVWAFGVGMERNRRRSCKGFYISNLGQFLDRQHGCDVYKGHCDT